jgi:UDP-glucose 4-epimerase
MLRKVTVIGGAGFIGSHLVELLISEGFFPTVIDNFSTGKKSNLPSTGIDIRDYDITEDPQRIAEMIKGSECVFHLAALTSVQESLDHPDRYTKVNVMGTANVLEACRLAGVKRVVFSSTSAIYGNTSTFPTSETQSPDPISAYALSKLVGETYAKYYAETTDVTSICLRYFNVFGERTNPKSSYRSVIPIFLEQFKNDKPLTITNDGLQQRDFIYVKDVALANLKAMSRTKRFDVINVGSGKTWSVNQIADMISISRENIGFRLEPKISLADVSRAQSVLDWKATTDLEAWIKDQIV